LIVQFKYQSTGRKNMSEEKVKQQPTNPWGPWAQYQEEQTKLWLRYWTGVMNSLFNTDLKK
jgi:hypothetical protein